MKAGWKTVLGCAAAALLLQGCAHVARDAGAMERETTFGVVRGSDDAAASGTWSWKGIPFAAPPVGPLRWRAPADPQRWSGVRAATRLAPACVQTGGCTGRG